MSAKLEWSVLVIIDGQAVSLPWAKRSYGRGETPADAAADLLAVWNDGGNDEAEARAKLEGFLAA